MRKLRGLVLFASLLIVGCAEECAPRPHAPQTETRMSAAPTDPKAVSKAAIAELRLGMTPQEVEGVLGPGTALSLPAYSYPALEGGSYWIAFFQVDPELLVDGKPPEIGTLAAVVHYPKDDETPRYILPASRSGKPFVTQTPAVKPAP